MSNLSIKKGMDAIFGSDTGTEDATAMDSDSIIKTNVDCLFPSKYQPRREFDEKSLKELRSSIIQQGVIQPLLVRKIGDEKYEIIAGERRWRAAKLANLSQVPVIVKNLDDNVALAVALIENIQRENLNSIEEAAAYQKLIDKFELTHDEVAKRVGKPRTTISNFLRLLRLEPFIQQLLTEKKIDMGHAKVLLALDEEGQARVGEMIIKRQLSVRQTEDLVRKHLTQEHKEEPSVNFALLTKVDQLKNVLSQFLGKRVDVKLKNTSEESGYLKLPFNSIDDLSRLVDQLQKSNKAEEGDDEIQ